MSMRDPLGYYQILDLTPAASEAEIKANYRERAKRWHPDHNTSEEATEKFQHLSVAYDVLKDEKSQETLLRAVTEIKTYLTKIEVNKDAFVRITESYKSNSEIKILPAVIFCDSEKIAEVNNYGYIKAVNRPKYEFNAMIKGNMPFLYQLCKVWNIEFFELRFANKTYCEDVKDKKGNRIRNYQKDQYTLTHLSY